MALINFDPQNKGFGVWAFDSHVGRFKGGLHAVMVRLVAARTRVTG